MKQIECVIVALLENVFRLHRFNFIFYYEFFLMQKTDQTHTLMKYPIEIAKLLVSFRLLVIYKY